MMALDMSPPPRRPGPDPEGTAGNRVPHLPRPQRVSPRPPSPYPRITREDPERRGQSSVIRVQRRADGLIYEYSIRMIAQGSHLSPAAVTRILRGQRTGKIQTLSQIAKFLGISLDALNHYLADQRPAAKR